MTLTINPKSLKFLYISILFATSQMAFCQHALYITSGSTIDTNTITLSDASLINNGTYNGSINMTGTYIDDTFIINNAIINFTTLDIDGNNAVYLEAREVNIFSAINLNSDNADLGMSIKNIILGPSAKIINESNDRLIIGANGTYIKTTRNHTTGVNNDFGGIGVKISNENTSMGSTEIFRKYGTFEINGDSTVSRYYEVNPTVNSDLYLDVRFYILDYDLNGLERSNLAAFRSVDNGVTFTNEGGITETLSHSISNLNAFSLWTFADASTLNSELFSDDDQSISIFPNPAIHANKGISILNIQWSTILEKKINMSLSENQSFSVSNLAEGMYLLKIRLENGEVNKKLVMKN